jgi:hypothetical protein
MRGYTSISVGIETAVAVFIPTYVSKNTPSGFRPKPHIKSRFSTGFRLLTVPTSLMEKIGLVIGKSIWWWAVTAEGPVDLGGPNNSLTRIERVLSKHADHVADVIIRVLSDIKGQVHTLTMANGNEFAQYERVAKPLQAKVYFAHPYCACERGANEDTKRLLR